MRSSDFSRVLWRVIMLVVVVGALIYSGFRFGLQPTLAQDTDSVAPVRTRSTAATTPADLVAGRQVSFRMDGTPRSGVLDGKESLLTIIVANDSDIDAHLKEIGVTIAIAGDATVWATAGENGYSHRINFRARGTTILPLFGNPTVRAHSEMTIEVFALIPDAPAATYVNAASLVSVEYFINSHFRMATVQVSGRTWTVP